MLEYSIECSVCGVWPLYACRLWDHEEPHSYNNEGRQNPAQGWRDGDPIQTAHGNRQRRAERLQRMRYK